MEIETRGASMSLKRSVSLTGGVFVLLLSSYLNIAAQAPPSPQGIRRQIRLHALTQSEEAPPSKAPIGPPAQLIAAVTERIDRDRLEIHVYQNGRPAKISPRFHELIAATPADHRTELEKVAGKGVALVPSEKSADRWDVYLGVGGVDTLCLAGNIFVVKQVLVSSRKSPIEVRVDGDIHRLKPGQVLLVL